MCYSEMCLGNDLLTLTCNCSLGDTCELSEFVDVSADIVFSAV